MKGVYITGYGKVDDVVRVGDIPNPDLHLNELMIEVQAAGVNPIDWKIIEGAGAGRSAHFPIPVGYDAAGIVRDVGSAVTRFQKGDEVFTRVDAMRPGTFAEWIAVDERLVAPKPRNIDFVQAAGVPLAALTAWQGLFEHMKLERGQKLLIQGGAGGVGSFAVQFAKHKGATVATTVGPDHIALAKRLKADLVIDYRKERFEDLVRDYDAVFDTVGGDVQARSLAILRVGGILVSTLGVPTGEKDGKRLMSFRARPDGMQLAEIALLIESGAVIPIIDHVYPLEQAKDALLKSRSGHAGGKIVIRMH